MNTDEGQGTSEPTNQEPPPWVHLWRYEKLHLPEAIKQHQENQLQHRFLRKGETDERFAGLMNDLRESGYLTHKMLVGRGGAEGLFSSDEELNERLVQYAKKRLKPADVLQGVIFERLTELRVLEQLPHDTLDQYVLFRNRLQALRESFTFDYTKAQAYVAECDAPVMLKAAMSIALYRGAQLKEGILHCATLGSPVAAMVLARPYLELGLGFLEWGLNFKSIHSLQELTQDVLKSRNQIMKQLKQADEETGSHLGEQIGRFYGKMSNYTHNKFWIGGKTRISHVDPASGYVVGKFGENWSETQVVNLVDGIQICHNLIDIGMVHIRQGIANGTYPDSWNDPEDL